MPNADVRRTGEFGEADVVSDSEGSDGSDSSPVGLAMRWSGRWLRRRSGESVVLSDTRRLPPVPESLLLVE